MLQSGRVRRDVGFKELAKIYWPDYVVLCTLLILVGVIAGFVNPYVREMPVNFTADHSQPMLDYRHWDHPICPWYVLFIITLGLPILVFGITQIWYKSKHDFHHACFGLTMAFAFTIFFTEIFKNQAGRERPDFYARIDNGDPDFIKDGRYSFPSGHASLSIANLSFVMYYLMGKMHILRPNGGELYKVVVAVFPLGIAWWISVSRTQDNHHNFSDIVGGMVMGFPFGLISYLLCYPTLTSPDCDVPKLRSDSDESGHHSLQEELF